MVAAAAEDVSGTRNFFWQCMQKVTDDKLNEPRGQKRACRCHILCSPCSKQS